MEMHIKEPPSSEAGQQLIWRDVNAGILCQLCFVCCFRNNEIKHNFGVQLKVIIGHDCVHSRTVGVYVFEMMHLFQQSPASDLEITPVDY